MSGKDASSKALAPIENPDELRRRIDSEVPALVGGFKLGPRRLARVGRVRLGTKKIKKRDDGSEVKYPWEASYFVFDDPEVEAVLVSQARASDVVEVDGVAHITALDIIFPLNVIKENAEVVFSLYNSVQKCLCTSRDGITARQTNPDTGEVKEVPCLNESCPKRQASGNKKPECTEMMRMRFIIPSIPPLGVWQLDSGSTWSKGSVLGYMRTLQAEITGGQLAGIRLKLFRRSTMIPNKITKRLEQHWPLSLVANVSYDNYAERLAEARAMTYKPEDVEEFDEAPDETIIPGNGDGELEVDGPPTVDPDTGEIILAGEEPMEAEIVSDPGADQDEPVGEPPVVAPAEPPKPAPVKMVANEQVQAILKLAERTWSDQTTAASSFKTWLGQMFPGVQNVRQLTHDQAGKTIKVLQSNLDRATSVERQAKG
ncbi:MAG TPA: hypothetical protein VFI02_00795 [Armatimonadota bacterium]|nr:hypothetical protein [Armatimonadota bacterium]